MLNGDASVLKIESEDGDRDDEGPFVCSVLLDKKLWTVKRGIDRSIEV